MLDAADALRGHARCKARLATCLSGSRPGLGAKGLAPDPDCILHRFIQEGEGVVGEVTEIRLLKVAHATVHAVAVGLAEKQAAGEAVDVEYELGSHSNYGAASSSLVAAVWRLEKKLHSLAG